jgi:hypothetical protein
VTGPWNAEVGLRMKVLLPYLIGAAFTFVVQYLVQVYVVPRVQTRRQREDRWVSARCRRAAGGLCMYSSSGPDARTFPLKL